MKYRTLLSSALVAFAALVGIQARAADNMASIAITPATGGGTLTPRWAVAATSRDFIKWRRIWD